MNDHDLSTLKPVVILCDRYPLSELTKLEQENLSCVRYHDTIGTYGGIYAAHSRPRELYETVEPSERYIPNPVNPYEMHTLCKLSTQPRSLLQATCGFA
jgi:hypothetical protein